MSRQLSDLRDIGRAMLMDFDLLGVRLVEEYHLRRRLTLAALNNERAGQ